MTATTALSRLLSLQDQSESFAVAITKHSGIGSDRLYTVTLHDYVSGLSAHGFGPTREEAAERALDDARAKGMIDA